MKIEFIDVDYIYNQGKPSEIYALRDINLAFDSSDFLGIIGHTGSGKSTLLQHMNGIFSPSKGQVLVDGHRIQSAKDLHRIRQRVCYVFQYPEYQLFEETVYKDIAFGPKNMALDEEEIHSRVKNAMELVGLNFEEFKDRSPFELSGGQKRRVAIAGVLSMNPEILVLDEPTAGLDPKGSREILSIVEKLYREGTGIVLVSHSMEEIAASATRVLVMDGGRIAMDGPTREVYGQWERLEELDLGLPEITRFALELGVKYPEFKSFPLTVEEAYRDIMDYFGGGKCSRI